MNKFAAIFFILCVGVLMVQAQDIRHLETELPGYVPEPQVPQSNYLIGMNYFPGWKWGTHRGWKDIEAYPDRTPLLGYYDEGNPEVMDWEIKWALEHGIDFFLFCWYRGPEGVKVRPSTMHLGHALHDGFFKAKYAPRFQFAIMWENQAKKDNGVADLNDLMKNLLPYWIENYFKRPNYVKINNKPLLVVYHLDRLNEELGGVAGTKKALDMMREACKKAGFAGLVIACEHRGNDRAFLTRMKDSGFDFHYTYCYHPEERQPTATQAINYQLTMLQLWQDWNILPVIPTLSVGFEPKPWENNNPETPWVYWQTIKRWRLNGPEWLTLLQKAKPLIDTMPVLEDGSKMVILDNWNEWSEGHYIAPSAFAGFQYLQAVRDVFSERDNLPDYRTPAQLGFGPYDLLYKAAVKDSSKK
jgi:hypothetical protein